MPTARRSFISQPARFVQYTPFVEKNNSFNASQSACCVTRWQTAQSAPPSAMASLLDVASPASGWGGGWQRRDCRSRRLRGHGGWPDGWRPCVAVHIAAYLIELRSARSSASPYLSAQLWRLRRGDVGVIVGMTIRRFRRRSRSA